jgi:hypothetical protein
MACYNEIIQHCCFYLEVMISQNSTLSGVFGDLSRPKEGFGLQQNKVNMTSIRCVWIIEELV